MHKSVLSVALQKQELGLLKKILLAAGFSKEALKRKLAYYRQFLSR